MKSAEITGFVTKKSTALVCNSDGATYLCDTFRQPFCGRKFATGWRLDNAQSFTDALAVSPP
jgi:hypothetical protein